MARLLFYLVVVLLFAQCAQKEQVGTDTRPNILFIMSDDHAYQAISAYDDALIHTPHIDRLAKEGILFTNASVTNSICAPSRATILTGKHTHIHGKKDNLTPFDTSQQTFPQLMQQAGYQTALFGKLHFGNNPKGFDTYAIVPRQGHYFNPEFDTPDRGKITIQGYATDIITDLSLDWLGHQRRADEPFMMMYFHKAPHRPWWPRVDKMQSYLAKTIPEPETLFDDFATRGEAARTAEMGILRHMLLSYDCKVLPEAVAAQGAVIDERDSVFFERMFSRATPAQQAAYQPLLGHIAGDFEQRWPMMSEREKLQWKYQRYMQDYLACIASVDDNVGRVLDHLDAEGLADNTIVIYTSDQGFYLGEHGWFDKRFIYNQSFKTPLLIRWPDGIAHEQLSDELVQNLDFAPTLLAAANIPIPTDMQGDSFLPLLTGKGDWSREQVYYHYYEYPGEHAVKRHYGISSKKYKLIHFYHDVDYWELFDLEKDPHELNNVYDQPAYVNVQQQMHTALDSLRVYYRVPDDMVSEEGAGPQH